MAAFRRIKSTDDRMQQDSPSRRDGTRASSQQIQQLRTGGAQLAAQHISQQAVAEMEFDDRPR